MEEFIDGVLGAKAEVRRKVRSYVIDSLLLGVAGNVGDSASLMEAGILDSTGAMELVAFLEAEFGFAVADTEITADNLDSIDRICALVARKQASRQPAETDHAGP